MTQPQVASGQTWVPRAAPGTNYPRIDEIRIVCRYPFETADTTPVWIVEYIRFFQKLERVAEITLRDLWQLSEDVSTLDR